MTWREDLRRVVFNGRRLIGASFRGVPFFVESDEIGGGRRAVVHEFPLRDLPYAEDLGAASVALRVDGYVIGDDYLTQKEALIAALQGEAGPGELVLPGHGVKSAICLKWGCRTSRGDGGMATFALEFVETPAQAPAPVEVVDSAALVSSGADDALLAVSAEFEEQYDVADLPAFALESAETALTEAAGALESQVAPIVANTQELAVLTGRIALLTAQASSLVREPASVLGEFRAAITGLVETAANAPGALMDALIDAYAIDLGPTVVPTTATRERERANQVAFVGALRRILALEAARLAPVVPYVSIEEATDARDRVAAMIEEQEITAEDTAFPALADLRSQVLRAVPGTLQLASVVTVTRNVPTPSLVLAYQLYGSVEREADIVARNSINHPGFVSGELRVLSDE